MTAKCCAIFCCLITVVFAKFENITFLNYTWFNEPKVWVIKDDVIEITTNENTDFWQETYYNFKHNDGHLFGVELKDDFTFTARIQADFDTLYDQAGLMVYVDDHHWLKAGIEYNDGEPMIGSVNTDGMSDWGTGIYLGDPKNFYMRLSKVNNVVCVKYSTDKIKWRLLRLAPFSAFTPCLVGLMTCSPQRAGLKVRFSEVTITEPAEDILHSN